ncbi:MAG: mechanosensitive ion channel family protein [Thermodesulfovibrionales bacterium]
MHLFERFIIGPFNGLYEQVLLFLPNLLASLLLFIVGILIGWLLRAISARVFRTLKLDRFAESLGLKEVLKKGGIQDPVSELLSRIIGWITIITFTIISLRALAIPSVEGLLERFLLYLPNVFAAALILLFGYLLSNFLGRAALIASVNAGIKVSGLIGRLIKLIIFILAITMSLEQLGIGSSTIVVAFAIVFGGIVFALALALGLGGREIAKEYLEKKLNSEEKKDEINHL